MKNIIINNNTFSINGNTSITDLLNITALQNITVEDWKKVLEQLYGKALFKTMDVIINYKIKQYDTSQNVNSFIYNNKEYWLDKATRVGLMNLINCSKDNIQLVLGDEILELDLDKARNFLAELEVYASKCYVNTQKHLNATKKLLQVEDIINYDYTTGYPEKIILNV